MDLPDWVIDQLRVKIEGFEDSLDYWKKKKADLETDILDINIKIKEFESRKNDLKVVLGLL